MPSKIALVTGVTGQDGAYLSNLLLSKGYEVVGTTRDSGQADCSRLSALKICDSIILESITPTDFHSIYKLIDKYRPLEIYHLAGISSVSLSFRQPVDTYHSNIIFTQHILQAVCDVNPIIKVFCAGSSESYGNQGSTVISEDSCLRPVSPYGISKASSTWIVNYFRSRFGLNVFTGHLSNHESPLRPSRFVSQKIIKSALSIASGNDMILELGNVDTCRDWGWAPDYVDAIYQLMQLETLTDCIIATGRSHTLREFVQLTFSKLGLEYDTHVRSNYRFMRKNDIESIYLSNTKLSALIDWNPTKFDVLVDKLISSSLY